jgi:hypothetical protein
VSRHAGPPSRSEQHLPTSAELAEFLSAQRWFSGRGSEVEVLAVRRLARLVEYPTVELLLVSARPADGDEARYQLVVECTTEPVPRLEHARIGAGACYDALHDRDVTQTWPRLMDAEETVDDVSFHRVAGATIGCRIHGDRLMRVRMGTKQRRMRRLQLHSYVTSDLSHVLHVLSRMLRAPPVNSVEALHLARQERASRDRNAVGVTPYSASNSLCPSAVAPP